MDEILFSDSSDSSSNCPFKFFILSFSLKSSNLIQEFSTLLLFLFWFGSLIKKYMTLSAKKHNWWIDLVFEN